MSKISERLKQQGIHLPEAPAPAGSYLNCMRSGDLLFVSGKGPGYGYAQPPKGKLGREFDVNQGYQFARSAGVEILATVAEYLGDLERIQALVKLQGFINVTEEFEQHAQVLSGCSDLMHEILAERGGHARSVMGAASLRAGLPLVIESIFEIRD